MAVPNFICVAEVDKGEVGIRECPMLDGTVSNPFIGTRFDGLREVTADIHETGACQIAQLLPVQKESRSQSVCFAVLKEAWNGSY
jgi:hypothetical protein